MSSILSILVRTLCADMTMTYGSADKHLGGGMLGGYSQAIVVREEFVLHIPANPNLAGNR